MGQRQSSRVSKTTTTTSATNPFKLFEYQCPNCKTKRPIQYFYRNETFLPQAPRVVCGECCTSVTVEPFKTVEYHCPLCKKWHKVRLPAKPIPLKMYNISVASCNCGFKGEVPVGKLMDVSCSVCWSHKRELRGVWTEDGDEVKSFCDTCQTYQRGFARDPKKKNAEQAATDMEYCCENCNRVRPVKAEEVLRNQGLAICNICGWVGYPEVVPKGQLDAKANQNADRTKGDKGKKKAEKSKVSPEKSRSSASSQDNFVTQMQSPVPQPSS